LNQAISIPVVSELLNHRGHRGHREREERNNNSDVKGFDMSQWIFDFIFDMISGRLLSLIFRYIPFNNHVRNSTGWIWGWAILFGIVLLAAIGQNILQCVVKN